MTENYPPASGPPRSGEPFPAEPLVASTEWDQATTAPPAAEPLADAPADQSTADTAKEQATELGQSTVQAGKRAAGTAKEQAAGVVAEAGRQGTDLLRQAQDQVGQQVAQGHQRLTGQLSSFSEELSSMADSSPQGGLATHLARHAASWAHDAGQWLGDREPGQVLDDVQSFARRRPGVFIALAAGVGLVAGRLTRGMTAAGDSGPAAGAGPESGRPSPVAGASAGQPWTDAVSDDGYPQVPMSGRSPVPADAGGDDSVFATSRFEDGDSL